MLLQHRFTALTATLFVPGGVGMMPLVWDPMLLQEIGQLVDRAPNVSTRRCRKGPTWVYSPEMTGIHG